MTIEENTPPSLGDIAAAAFDAVESGEVAPQAEALPFDEPADGQAAPDAPADAPAGQVVEGEAAPPDAGDPVDPPADAQTLPADDRAPSSWKPEIAQKWAEVPQEVRDEIKRRETDYHKGIEQYKQAANIGHEFERVLTPNMDMIQAAGVNPVQATEYLFNAHRVLTHGTPQEKAMAIGRIARDCGIDLATVRPPPPIDPAMMELQRQNHHLQQYRQGIEHRETAIAVAEIERFAADPKNVHWNAVVGDVEFLLSSSKATDLQDAYDKAVWMRPDIRKSLVEQQRTEAEKTATAQARDKRAKAAAVGVKGSAPSKGGVLKPGTDLRGVVAAAWNGDIS